MFPWWSFELGRRSVVHERLPISFQTLDGLGGALLRSVFLWCEEIVWFNKRRGVTRRSENARLAQTPDSDYLSPSNDIPLDQRF
jgi:hypothetical protein